METKELAVAGQSVEITPAGSKNQILALDNTLKSARQEIAIAEAEGNDMLKALTLAKATQMVRDMLTPLMGDIMHLVGSPLGIKTDRDNQPENGRYGVEVIRDAVLGSLLRGARVVGNEINVIGGNGYLTKEYWERQFREAPGVSHVQPPTLGIPRETKLGERVYASVQCRLDWQLNGKNDHLELTNDKSILVAWNRGMGVDALHGKAKKRLYQMAYARVTGQQIEYDDDSTTVEAASVRLTESEKPTLEEATAAENGQQVQDLLQDVEGTLVSLDSIVDCQKAGDHFKRSLVEATEAGRYTESEAAGLVKIISGLVDSRCKEIRNSRGQRSNGK